MNINHYFAFFNTMQVPTYIQFKLQLINSNLNVKILF